MIIYFAIGALSMTFWLFVSMMSEGKDIHPVGCLFELVLWPVTWTLTIGGALLFLFALVYRVRRELRDVQN